VEEIKDDGLDNNGHCITVFGRAGVILEANVCGVGKIGECGLRQKWPPQ
jgi:hypothetical protein